MSKKVVVVIGATGAQGGSVAEALLADGNWTVRALTRNPDSDKGKALKAKGAEVVAADINNAGDLEKAFAGAYGVFAVTNFYEIGGEGEIRQVKLITDAAKKQNVSHVIYASLENTEKISGGKNKVPHFTSKAIAHDYLTSSGIAATEVQIACYYENWLSFFCPRPNAEGIYEFAIPVPADTKFALGSVGDIGHVVLKVFEDKDKFAGKKVAVVGDHISPGELAATIAKVWGKQVRFNYVTPEVFAKFGFPHAEEFADMFDFFTNFGYYGEKVNGRDIWEGKKLYPELKTFEQFWREKVPSAPSK